MMISIFHLFWICPVSAIIGILGIMLCAHGIEDWEDHDERD